MNIYINKKTKNKNNIIGEIKNIDYETIFESIEENNLKLVIDMIPTTEIKEIQQNNSDNIHYT